MKQKPTLFFNGCSFVHGDSLLTDFPGELNLSDRVSKLTDHKTVNLAIYGATNDLITFTTIEYFNNLSPEERKNHVACIGWTECSRTMIPHPYLDIPDRDYINPDNIYNLQKLWMHLNLIVLKHADEDVRERFRPLVKEMLIHMGEPYWFKEHVKNIILLENYFKANGIPYMFWNSIGLPINRLDKQTRATFEKYVDWTKWINWAELDLGVNLAPPPNATHQYNQKYGVLGMMMNDSVKYEDVWTSTGHPGPITCQKWAEVLVQHLKIKNLIEI
jgi:hypothetical protein